MGLDRGEVAVLCGGPGVEREVSLISGTEIARGLREAGVNARRLELAGTEAEIGALRCDVAFLALHGEWGEDGTVQRLLEARRIPYTGSRAAASALAMDKPAAKRAMAAAGVRVPRGVTIERAEDAAEALRAAGLAVPVVVKPAARGSSVATSIVRDAAELADAAARALAVDRVALIEEFITGRELTAGVLGSEALPLVELVPDGAFYDYQAKYVSDRTRYLCPAPLDAPTTDLLQRIALRVVAAVGAEHLSRTDILLGPDGPVVLEINTLPGFTTHSLLPKAAAAAGIAFSDLCLRILDAALARGAP